MWFSLGTRAQYATRESSRLSARGEEAVVNVEDVDEEIKKERRGREGSES